MIPKEKAKELVRKYRKEILKVKYRIDGFVVEELAEECALVAVDEILFELDHGIDYDYWQEVKQEIEKI